MKLKTELVVLLMLLTWATVSVSCKKDVRENKQKTRMELLTTGSWKRTSFISDPAYDWHGDGIFATDILNVMNPCELDDFETYYTDGTWELNQGPTSCHPLDPQTRTLPWEFAENETTLVFNGSEVYIVEELTATTLKTRQTFLEDGVIYTHYETYSH